MILAKDALDSHMMFLIRFVLLTTIKLTQPHDHIHSASKPQPELYYTIVPRVLNKNTELKRIQCYSLHMKSVASLTTF